MVRAVFPKKCNFPTCKKIAINGTARCALHPYDKMIKRSTTRNQDFYNSTQWRKLRDYKIKLNPLCEECLKHNALTPAKIADHKTEINDGGEKLDLDNLRSLCIPCHNTKTSKAKKERNKTR